MAVKHLQAGAEAAVGSFGFLGPISENGWNICPWVSPVSHSKEGLNGLDLTSVFIQNRYKAVNSGLEQLSTWFQGLYEQRCAMNSVT